MLIDFRGFYNIQDVAFYVYILIIFYILSLYIKNQVSEM